MVFQNSLSWRCIFSDVSHRWGIPWSVYNVKRRVLQAASLETSVSQERSSVVLDMVCFHTIYFGCHSFYAVFSTKSKFQSIVGNNSTLHWFCFKSPCDWFRKIAPRFQSIRCKAKPVAACSSAFSRALGCALLWLAVGITLIRFYDTQCKGASFA